MEPQSNEHSPSPSGSEEMESDADSEHEDEVENEKDSDAEDQSENDRENSDNSDNDDSDTDDSDDDDNDDDSAAKEEEEDEEQETAENENPVSNQFDRNTESPFKKGINGGSTESSPKPKRSKSRSYKPNKSKDTDCYMLDDLPLEVITTVEPTTYSYPVLKNMSNGVLTQRNIFTEHERAVLRDIINKYRNIVDTRSRTREIYLEKQNVWQLIVEEYNSTENIMVRTEKELRKCWDNMKYRAKQAEKEMVKTEKSDGSFDTMDIQAITQQAFEEAVKFQQQGGGAKKTSQHPEPQVKMEPVDLEAVADNEDDDSNFEPPEGESNLSADEDREPALKKARQESPKLSSLLLSATRKNSSSRKNGKNRDRYTSSHKIPYNIPECTKILPVKKKSHVQNFNHSPSATDTSALGDFPVSILPKGLATCLSITNIPNPVNIGNHINSNHSFQHKDGVFSSLTSPLHNSMKPMPSLKKMVPSKYQSNGSCKTPLSRSSKRSANAHLTRERDNCSNSPPIDIGNSSNPLNSMQSMNNFLTSLGMSCDNSKCDPPEKVLSMKLTAQRLEFERQEHEMKMRLLEKELQSQAYQSQYWALKLKLLRSGRENNAFHLTGATNGDID
ncbi:hypothetical protein SK128_028518 [Halocaridina rubra]|uniref:Myb/SANT-like DNA-binding domain-containing protein 3 n=1 Tax=Halocaridina rubra TaxID=373956 RepID=A0AAN8XQP0_HALRR